MRPGPEVLAASGASAEPQCSQQSRGYLQCRSDVPRGPCRNDMDGPSWLLERHRWVIDVVSRERRPGFRVGRAVVVGRMVLAGHMRGASAVRVTGRTCGTGSRKRSAERVAEATVGTGGRSARERRRNRPTGTEDTGCPVRRPPEMSDPVGIMAGPGNQRHPSLAAHSHQFLGKTIPRTQDIS